MSTVNIQTVLAQRPLGMVVDIDGTLSPIAPTPEEARLYPGVKSVLEHAREQTDVHIAVMTGRSIEDGARMINVDGLTYVGTHGLEWSDGLPWLHSVQVVPEALTYVKAGTDLLDLAEQKLAGLQGIIIERKRVGGTIHYRLCPHPDQARRMILSILDEPARKMNMRLDQEKQAIEIRTPLRVNKGQALLWFILRFGLLGVIFAGDGRTDLDAVLEIAHLRKQGMPALSIVVQYTDTLPELIEHADLVVQGVEEMVELLREMVNQLSKQM